MSARYFNWKLAIVLVIGVAVLGVGAFSLRQWRVADKADRGLELGNKAYDEHRWEDAAENFGDYLAVEQDDTSVLLKYAESQLKIRPTKSSRVHQATGAYRTVLRADKGNFEAAKKLTEIYLATGSAGEAELIARRQIEIKPDPELHRMLALALIGQRKFQEAATEIKTIIEKHPEHILAYETLGQLVEQRPEDFSDAPARWFDQAVENNPSSALAYIVRAGFHRRNENASEALADLEEAEKLDLSDATVRLRLARELIVTGLLDRAESHLVLVRETTAADQDLWQTWGRLALRSRSKEKMLTVAETGLKELSSQPWDFMPLAAELFVLGGRLEDANDCISKLQAKDVGPETVAFLRGLVAAEQGQLSDAARHWRQSMESGNKSPQIRLALASALSGLGDTQSAMLQLRTVVSERPDYFEGRLALARLLARVGNWADVSEHAAAAMKLSPEDPDAALLAAHAQAQLLSASPPQNGAAAGQAWRDMRKRLSALEKSSGATAEVKLMQFQLALQYKKLAEAERLAAELEGAGLSGQKIAVAEAELLAVQGNLDQAIQRLYPAIEKFPDEVELVSYAAILLDRQDDREECEAVVRAALARITDPASQRRLGLLLARFYVSWDRKDDAYPLLGELAEKIPGDIPIKRRLLLCEQTMTEPGNAQRLVDEIKSLEGESGWQWRYEQARVWFAAEDFKTNYARIVSLLQENLVANSDDQASRVFLARSYERAGALQLALSTYREALNRSPDDLRVIIPAVAALYGAKEYEQAEQILDRASKQKLSHPLLSELVLQDHLRRGELALASVVLQDILTDDPNNRGAYLSLALLTMQQGEFEEAAILLNKLKEQDPNSLAVIAAQIQLSVRRDTPDEAIRISDEAVNKFGSAIAYVLRARTYATLKQTDKAWEDLERAASTEPNNVEVWVARSDFNRSARRYAQAVADIRQARSLDPEGIGIQKRAISLFLASRDHVPNSEGRALLEKALESNPEDVELRLYKA
ncbi:MAG: tetratricopeptide repeat protein, partial [Planctomycetota bacterium]